MNYETVCGIEVHTELAAKTKIFCSCTTAFGGEPNTHCCEVCTGLPGALPALNRQVLTFALRCCVALHCEVTKYNRFDRKNYFYPDLPKAYQISQLYLPIGRNGYVEITDSQNGGKKRVGIHEIHMEEDAGKLIHQDGRTLVNYNRAGIPLLEIVSEPDLRSGAEAAEYTQKLREILMFCGISDCKMQEGSLRADVNVSVRKVGSNTLNTRTEMKNLSSFKAIKSAVDNEAKRQAAAYQCGEPLLQQTRRFDEKTGASYAMRAKEESQDYKYFPEPDLPPLMITDADIQSVKNGLSELPDAKRARYIANGLTPYDADVICTELSLVELFEKTAALTGEAKLTANWITGEVMALRREYEITPALLAAVLRLLKSGRITRETAKRALAACAETGETPETYIVRNRLEITGDAALVRTAVSNVLSNNPKAVGEYREGKEKALNYLVGQCMKALKGAAAAEDVRTELKKQI